jgi:branched-chain amino acid transport system permease protein
LMIYAFLVIVLMVYSPAGLIGFGDKLMQKIQPKREVRKDMDEGAQL